MIKYLILLVIFSSCLSKTKKAKKIEPVSIQYDFNIDSLKWCFYTLNYQGNAFFYDSANKKKLIFKPTECSVVLDVYNKKNKDTSYYFFKFNKCRNQPRKIQLGQRETRSRRLQKKLWKILCIWWNLMPFTCRNNLIKITSTKLWNMLE